MKKHMTDPKASYRDALENALFEARGAAQAALDAIEEKIVYLDDPEINWSRIGSLNHVTGQLAEIIAHLEGAR